MRARARSCRRPVARSRHRQWRHVFWGPINLRVVHSWQGAREKLCLRDLRRPPLHNAPASFRLAPAAPPPPPAGLRQPQSIGVGLHPPPSAIAHLHCPPRAATEPVSADLRHPPATASSLRPPPTPVATGDEIVRLQTLRVLGVGLPAVREWSPLGCIVRGPVAAHPQVHRHCP